MKIRNKIIWTFLSIFIGIGIVHAAPGNTFYTSSNSVEAGSKVTATLKLTNVAAWNIKIVSNGSTSGCDASFADATSNGGNTTKNLTVTCKSTGVGQISFRATGDATSSDGTTANINAVKVVVVTSPRQKDTNNYLNSLGVNGYNISPQFNRDTLEYSLNVPSTVNKVTIHGAKASNYATVSGLGEVELNEGINTFYIKVTSETGAERIYKLIIHVKDENPIEININDKTYTVMKNAKNLEAPSTYEATSIKINEMDIPAFYSETSKFTLIGIKDEKGNISFAIYDKDTDTYQIYNENKSNQLLLFIESIPEEKEGYIKSTITINETMYECLKPNEDSKVILLYAMDIMTGKTDYYLYDEAQNTYFMYQDEMMKNISKPMESKQDKNRIVLLSGLLFVTIFILVVILLQKFMSKNKKRKIIEE